MKHVINCQKILTKREKRSPRNLHFIIKVNYNISVYLVKWSILVKAVTDVFNNYSVLSLFENVLMIFYRFLV